VFYQLGCGLTSCLAGWLAGGWWYSRREMTKVELLDMKSRELRNGRLAM
jgi:hypothetical protein